MRIAILSFTNGMIDRGVEAVVSELTKQWEKNGHKVKVFTAESENFEVNLRSFPKFSLGRILMFDDYHRTIWRFTQNVLVKLEKFKPEIVMPFNGGWQSWLCKRYCAKNKAKLVISGQAGLGWCDGWNLLMRPDVFVALSRKGADWAKKFYGRGVRVEVIPNGVDLKRFKPRGKRIKLGLERPIILCVAGKDKYKRVEAVKKAVKKLGQGSLLWVGGDKKFKHKDMPEVYRSADLFTLVSESSEAFGIVYLEALASGLPVVAIDDELRREILGKYGIYVKDPTDINEYEGKLKLGLKKEKKRPEKWLRKFSWDRIAQEYIKLFESL